MRWRELLLNNLGWKLLALALAIMIWSGAQNLESPLQPVIERTLYDVPVRVLGTSPEGLQPVRLDPPITQLEVIGESFLVKRLRPSDPLVFVELRGENLTEPVTNHLEARLPSGVRLLNLLPNHVVITPLHSHENSR
jgi:hypothetical protein